MPPTRDARAGDPADTGTAGRAAHGPAPASAGSSAKSTAVPMVGRADAVAAIRAALAGGAALVAVEGEPGIGKSRLLREALAERTAAGTRGTALLATCPAVAEPFPLGAVVDAIRRLRPDLPALGLSPLAGALRPLYPEWSSTLPPTPEPLDDPHAIRHRLFRALSELVERLGVDVIVVEDVHWADTATLDWLLMLAADGMADRGLSIVVSYRPWDVPEDSLLPRLTARTPPGATRAHIALRPLSVADVRDLVASVYSHADVSAQFAEFLHGATDGIPLAVEEYLLLLEERRDILHDGGKWVRRALAELEVPPTVRASVLERVRGLDPGTRRLLDAAGVLTAPADAATLAAVAETGVPETRRGLSAALAAGLLREHTAGRFAFRHGLDAQAVREAMPVSERRRLHENAARALAGLDPRPAALLAHHFREAGNVEQWCVYAEESAVLAAESGDDHAAVDTLLNVVDAALGAGLPPDRIAAPALRLGRTAFFGAASLGELATPVVDALRRVLDVPGLSTAHRGELRLMLGRMSWATGERRAAYELWEAAVPDLADRPDLAVRAMSNMALPLIPDWTAERHLGWLDRSAELVDRVSAADRRAHDDMRMSALLLLGEPAGWTALETILESLARAAGDRAEGREVASGLVNVAWSVMAWGRLDRAREQVDLLDRLADDLDYPRLRQKTRAARQWLAWYTGDWAALPDRIAEITGDGDVAPVGAMHVRQVRALLRLAAGGEPARRELTELTEEHARHGVTEPESVGVRAALARLDLVGGDPAGALAVCEPTVRMIVHKGVWLWATDLAPVHVGALIALGRVNEAETFTDAFGAAIAGRELTAPEAALAACRGAVAEAAGEPGRAAEWYAEAARRWAAMPRPYDELLCLERRGGVLSGPAAVEVLVDVQRRLHDLGARWDADRVARTIRDRGGEVARTWRGGRRGYGDRLSPRELDVVRLVARGTSNRETAELLFLSPRTVEGHVTSAMRKLGVRSRTGLAVAAVEAGLVEQPGE